MYKQHSNLFNCNTNIMCFIRLMLFMESSLDFQIGKKTVLFYVLSSSVFRYLICFMLYVFKGGIKSKLN